MPSKDIMRILNQIVILLLLCYATVSNAEVTPGPRPNAEGDLGLIIVASHTPDYINEWLTTPSNHGVTIKRLKTAHPNQLIVTSFLASGFTPDSDGNFSFVVSFSLVGPDKKVVFGQKNYAAGKGTMPNKPTYVMADPALDIVFESSDAPGIYTIIGIVEDMVTNKKVRSEYKIQYISN